jgi:hypothetical protein
VIKYREWFLMIVLVGMVAGCRGEVATSEAPTVPTPIPTLLDDVERELSPTIEDPREVQHETEKDMFTIEATVWTAEPRLPILTYHRFLPDTYDHSTNVKMRLGDFRLHLESLYESGYSLVSLGDWLAWDLQVPPGRRPLVLTIDDLFFADQISLTEAGEPSPDSGIGVLWQFSQAHPDFGFAVALFPNLGDKLYLGGEDALARVIVWCIENNAIPYNHFYMHPRLDLTTARGITWEARMNDQYLRELLREAGREDLISALGNIFALPYGVWPDTQSGRNAMLSYVTPEGVGVQAVLEVDFAVRAQFAAPPYAPGFDPLHLPRIVGTLEAIDLLMAERLHFPEASACFLESITPDMLADPRALQQRLRIAHSEERCPPGVYAFDGHLFDVGEDSATLMVAPSPSSE